MHRPTRRDGLRERVIAGRMRQDARRRRAAVARKGGRRLVAVFSGLAVVAGLLTATQLTSSALEDSESGLGAGEECPETVVIEEVATDEDLELHVEEDADGYVHYHYRKKPGWGGGEDDGGESAPPEEEAPEEEAPEEEAPEEEAPEEEAGDCESEGSSGDEQGDGSGDGEGSGDGSGDGEGSGDGDGDGSGDGSGDGDGDGNGSGDGDGSGNPDDGNNGLDVLGTTCDESGLAPHTGFQAEEAQCVDTQMGEVSAAENNPTLLITDFPDQVGVEETFTITVSTRNLVRDRFLGAGDGGYYLESSFLDGNGIQRGHFHTGCLNLVDGNIAPEASTTLDPQFFAAVEDGGGGADADFVEVEVPGLSEPGLYRCMVWAGDGSHRVPMMSFARQQIAVDAVRITVE